MRSTAAFTILELLITIAMLGLLAGIALPNFTTLIHRQQLNQAAAKLADGLRETRTLAIAKNLSLRFIVNLGPPVNYCITADTCSDGLVKSDQLSERIDVVFQGNFDQIQFDTRGLVTTPSPIPGTVIPRADLNYQGENDPTRSVFLTSKLGKVAVQ